MLENLEEMLHLYYMDSADVSSIFKYLTTHWCAAHLEKVNGNAGLKRGFNNNNNKYLYSHFL